MLKDSEDVAKEMKKLDELTNRISDSMEKMTSGAVQISKAIHEVNDMSNNNQQSINNLSKEVNKFRV